MREVKRMDFENIYNMFQNLQDLALSISNVLNISVLDALKQTIGKIPGLGNFIIYLIEGIPGIQTTTIIQFLIGSAITTLLTMNIYKFIKGVIL